MSLSIGLARSVGASRKKLQLPVYLSLQTSFPPQFEGLDCQHRGSSIKCPLVTRLLLYKTDFP